MNPAEKLILCVDDDTFTLSSLKDALYDRYKVMLALDPDTGINLAMKHLPDLIMLDINMPGMSGIEAAEMLRRVPSTKEIPIVFLSAYDTDLEKKRATALGAAAFLGKPCSLQEVCDTVDGVLA